MPDWNKSIREYLNLPEMTDHRDQRAIQELADHLEDSFQEALSRGATPEEAEASAWDWLGDSEVAVRDLLSSERHKAAARVRRAAEGAEDKLRHRGRAWIPVADLIRDLRMALRGLRRRPAFSGVVIFVLALGIGSSTAIFTLLDAIILSPLPFDEADRLISISHAGDGPSRANMGQTAAWHFTYEEENRVFEDLGMWGFGSAPVTGAGDPEAVQTLYATSGVLRALRLNPVVGRGLITDDEDLQAPSIVLLSEGYWVTRFGGDPGVVGRTLQINGTATEIVGVLPMGLRGLGVDPSLILPLQFDKSTLFVGNTGFGGLARLREGVTLEEASTDIARMLPMAFEKFPGGPVIESMMNAGLRPSLQTLKASVVGTAANLIWVLMAGVTAVLLIACANVANLLLVRAEGKEGEMAVRAAMGASGNRIGWEYMKESLLLGVLGGAAGLALAQGGLRILAGQAAAQLPRMDELSLNPSVLLFALTVSVGSGVFFGMFPILRHGRRGLVNALKQGRSRGMGGKRTNRTRNLLAVTQMALALVLLVASGLMVRTSFALSDVDPGFRNPGEILAFRITVSGNEARTTDEVAAMHEAITRRLEEVPGVTSVALSNSIPMDGSGNVNPFFAEGVDEPGELTSRRRHKWIGGGYFETLQIPVVAGRAISWDDAHARLPVAMVSETMAREYWGSAQAALGRRVAARPDPPQWYEVVGVVADVREFGLNQDPPVVVYWPQVTLAFWQGNPADQPNTWRSMSYAIRSDRVGTTDFLTDVREAIWSVGPDIPVRNVSPLSDLMSQSVAQTSFSLSLLALAAVMALFLGVIGVYGVISYTVSQRAGELGMRIALGAPAEKVRGMVLRQGLTLAFVGVGVGLALAMGVSSLLEGLLFGVDPRDPVTYGSVAAGLVAVALVASYLPARRASKVDPMTALRTE